MKKKILFISHRAKHGGGERSLFELIIELNASGKIIPFIILGEKGWLYDKLKDAGFAPVVLDMKPLKKFNIKTAYKILRIIKTQKINIIHANTTRAMLYSAIAKMFSGVSIVWHNRGTDKRGLFEYLLSLFAGRLIAISNTVKQQLLDLGVKPEKVICIYNGLPLIKTDNNIRNFPKNSDNYLRIGLVGRFTVEKGHLFLVETANFFVNKLNRKKYRFVFCGAAEFGDSAYDEILKLIDRYNLAAYFEFKGFIENIQNFIAENIDITVLPSQREAFGRVILESYAAYTPVIAFDIEGPSEIIEHNKSGLLVEKNNIEQLARAIEKIADDRVVYNSIVSEGLNRLKMFDIKNTAAQALAVYNEIS